MNLEPIETASIDELRALQLQRLKWSVQHAYDNVAHYRDSFRAAGVHPHDLRSLDDLAKFPFTVKDDLRASYPFGMFAVPRDQVVRIHASSGTTGKPTVVGYTAQDIDTWAQLMARSIRASEGRATSCMSPTVMACSPADSARTTAPSGSVAPSYRCPADRRRSRCN
jgi:phenylacetate-CoA ligase